MQAAIKEIKVHLTKIDFIFLLLCKSHRRISKVALHRIPLFGKGGTDRSRGGGGGEPIGDGTGWEKACGVLPVLEKNETFCRNLF
jgi:hypothetical protein